MIEYRVFDKDEFPVDIADQFHEVRSKIVINLFNESLKHLRDGEVIVTEGWITDKNYGGEYRIILQGRRVGAGKDQSVILGPNGLPIVRIPT